MSYKRFSFLYSLLLASCLDAVSAINLSHDSAIKYPNEKFMVTCKDELGQPVTWIGPKGPLGPKTHPKVETASYGTSMVFMLIREDDSGTYICKAGSHQKVFELTVNVPVSFVDTKAVQSGVEDENATLRCEVKGGVKPIITWGVVDGELLAPKYQQIGDGLFINNVTRADAKIYICKAAEPSTGDIKDQKIKFKVEHKPVPKHSLWVKEVDVWGFINGEVNLTCEVLAEPPPRFEWLKGPRKITESRIYNELHKSVLQILIKDKGAFANYVCNATNKMGTLEQIFNLQEGVQPKPPQYITLREANSEVLVIGVHPSETPKHKPEMEPIEYRVQYKLFEEKSDWVQKDFEISNEGYALENLKHDTEYEIRAATKNRAGYSNYSNTTILRTLKSGTSNLISSKSITYILCMIILINYYLNEW